MVTSTTIERLRWHAGLHRIDAGDAPSIASSTWPRGHMSKAFNQAVEDCLTTLVTLNRELNHEGSSPVAEVPRKLVYAMTEISWIIRECSEKAREETEASLFSRAAWRLETAWSAVIAGDIEDILNHVRLEEAARFS